MTWDERLWIATAATAAGLETRGLLRKENPTLTSLLRRLPVPLRTAFVAFVAWDLLKKVSEK